MVTFVTCSTVAWTSTCWVVIAIQRVFYRIVRIVTVVFNTSIFIVAVVLRCLVGKMTVIVAPLIVRFVSIASMTV